MEKKLKVLEVLDCYYPSIDGPILVLQNLCENFVKSGKVDVEIMVPKYPKYKDNQPFKVHRIGPSILGPEKYYVAIPNISAKAHKIFKEKKYDIIHCHTPFTLASYALRKARKLGIPTLLTVHTRYRDDFERKMKTKLGVNFMMNYQMKVMNYAEHMSTVSDGAAQTIHEYGYKGPIEVFRNGTDLKYPDNAEELVKGINEKYDIKPDERVFIFCGRVVSNKNIDTSIDALKIIKDKGYSFKFMIIGEGTHLEHLKKKAKDLGMQNEIIFTGRIADRNELSAHYLRGDLFLFPSVSDTAGLVVLEAAALKVPSLVIKNSGAAEVITDGVNGLLAEENTPQSMAEQIEKVFTNNKFIASLKENAKQQIAIPWEKVADNMYHRYLEIIEEYKQKNIQKEKTKKQKKGTNK